MMGSGRSFPHNPNSSPSRSTMSTGQKNGKSSGVSTNLFLDKEPLSLFNTTPRNMTYFLQQVEPLAHFHSYAVKEMIRDGKHPWTLAYILFLYWLLWWDLRFIWVLPQLALGGWCFRCYYVSRGIQGNGDRRLSQKSPPTPTSSTGTIGEWKMVDVVRETFCFRLLTNKSAVSPILDQFWISGPGSLLQSEVVFGSVSKDWHSRITDEMGRPDNGNLKSNNYGIKGSTVDLDAILLLLQLGQNAMGLAALFLDKSYQILDSLDWTFPLQTAATMLDISLSLIPAYFAFHLISFRSLFFWLGISPVLIWLKMSIVPKLPFLGFVQMIWGKSMRFWFYRQRSQPKGEPEILVMNNENGISEIYLFGPSDKIYRIIGVYENQRWWLGLSWQPHLFTSERPLYTNEKGNLYCPLEAFKDFDRGWRKVGLERLLENFVDSNEVDYILPDSLKKHRDTLLETCGDWEYGDTDWDNLQKYPSPLSVVRRRIVRIVYEIDWDFISFPELIHLTALSHENKVKVD